MNVSRINRIIVIDDDLKFHSICIIAIDISVGQNIASVILRNIF